MSRIMALAFNPKPFASQKEERPTSARIDPDFTGKKRGPVLYRPLKRHTPQYK
jgi:hypothetical protein